MGGHPLAGPRARERADHGRLAQQGIVKVHGHGGSTKVEWIDIANPIPSADYGSAWTELRGYVEHAADDGGMLAPELLLDYLDELKRRALAPGRDWIAKLVRQDGEATR